MDEIKNPNSASNGLWFSGVELNHRPTAYKAVALTAELPEIMCSVTA